MLPPPPPSSLGRRPRPRSQAEVALHWLAAGRAPGGEHPGERPGAPPVFRRHARRAAPHRPSAPPPFFLFASACRAASRSLRRLPQSRCPFWWGLPPEQPSAGGGRAQGLSNWLSAGYFRGPGETSGRRAPGVCVNLGALEPSRGHRTWVSPGRGRLLPPTRALRPLPALQLFQRGPFPTRTPSPISAELEKRDSPVSGREAPAARLGYALRLDRRRSHSPQPRGRAWSPPSTQPFSGGFPHTPPLKDADRRVVSP
ncbi:serine/arginine repetitive matrix protein 1-like [Pseudonaja textilis]|uniref:serine/arginine repetitive matrix protein 1-like n=1 Tax=Pseudonaja textilis TaxID=8673 RepID=UPI000EA94C0C|nr:serine/arginine repetitive matrix protein 1-like [Pseudonaja textilis]